jgi:hypothetical protein
LAFENLDDVTRPLMDAEIDIDIGSQPGLYLSNYLNDDGKRRWPALLREAAVSGTDDSLAARLSDEHCFREKAERKTQHGVTMVKVPYTAAQTLAEAQFNMFYMRALACRAIAEGRPLVVYRAKETAQHRATSEAMEGTALDPQMVLDALRATRGVDPPIGIPLPNSGMTVRLG